MCAMGSEAKKGFDMFDEVLKEVSGATGQEKPTELASPLHEYVLLSSKGQHGAYWARMVTRLRTQVPLGTEVIEDENISMRRLIDTVLERIEILEQETNSIKMGVIQQMPTVYNATVYTLGHDKYELTMPLQVVVEEDEAETVARVPELNIYASADTDTEAIFELKRELIRYYEHLRVSKRKLGPLPQSHLETLKRLIIEKNG